MRSAPIPLEEMDEKEWQRQVVALARMLGYRTYHTLRSKGSQPGYPDLTLVRAETSRFVMLELKSEIGRTTEAQREWITDLHRAGVEVYVVRPRQLQALATVLKSRTSPGYAPARDELLIEVGRLIREAA